MLFFSHQVPFPHLEKRHAVGVLQLEKVRRTHARRVSQWVQLSFTETHVQHCCSITSWLLFLFLSRFIGAPDAPTITYKHNSIRHVHYSLLYEYVLIIRPDFSFSCGKNHFGLVACFVFFESYQFVVVVWGDQHPPKRWRTCRVWRVNTSSTQEAHPCAPSDSLNPSVRPRRNQCSFFLFFFRKRKQSRCSSLSLSSFFFLKWCVFHLDSSSAAARKKK